MEEQLPDFTDEDAIRAWLEAQSPQVCACFASRAALRTLPAILVEWSRIHENPAGPELVFAILRATLTSSVAVQPAALESKDRDGMRAALSSAATAAAGSHFAAADTAAIAARSALGGFSAAHPAARAVFEAARTTVSPPQSTLLSLAADAVELTNASHPETVFSRPLWWNMHTPTEWSTAILNFEISPDPAWTWWAKWYRQMFDGAFRDWAVAEEIALLPDNDWDQGPAHIARQIEIIEARRALERRIAELKAQSDAADIVLKQLLHRNHNNPPELIGDEVENFRSDIAQLRNEIAQLRSELGSAKKELAKPEPSPSLLRAIAQFLWKNSRAIAFGATAGGAVGTAVVAELLQPGSVASVAENLAEFAKLLGG